MLPINFLFLTVWPVVDMRLRCKSNGQDFPPDVPLDITKVVELYMVINNTCLSLFLQFPFLKFVYVCIFIYKQTYIYLYIHKSGAERLSVF